MKVRLFVIACLMVFCGSVMADEFLVSNFKALFPAEKIKSRRMGHPLFGARLSPSGKHLIYPKMVPATPPDYETTFEMVAYEIATGKEESIEVSLPGGYESVYTRFNFFNPAGDKLVMSKFHKDDNGRQSEIVYYDFKKKKIVSTGIKGQRDIAMFDNTNNNILISKQGSGTVVKTNLNGAQSKEVQVGGWVHTPSMFSPYAALFVMDRSREERPSLQVWSLKSEKMVVDLPLNEKYGANDDVQGQWTADGRYFFYPDVLDLGKSKYSFVVRVWDVVKNQQKKEVPDSMIVGYGPGKNTMVMTAVDGQKKQGRMFLYDVKNDKSMDIGPKGASVIHAAGNKLLYVVNENGKDMVCIADMAVVESEWKR